MKARFSRAGQTLAALTLATVALAGCSGSDEPGANQYEAPSATGAGLATTARSLDDLSAQKTEVKPVDLTGENRSIQKTDEWKVCTQSIEPGAVVDFTAEVEVGVVKADEECPVTGYRADVEETIEEGISNEVPTPEDGWAFQGDVTNVPLSDVLAQIDQEQDGNRSNFTAVHVETAQPVKFSDKYKVCFTNPSNITTVDPKSNLVIGLFVIEKNKQCMTEAEFNAGG